MNTQRLAENWLKLPTNLSTYVVGAMMLLADYWLGLSAAEQAALLASYPWLQKLAVPAGFALFVLSRVWPQNAPTMTVEPAPVPTPAPEAAEPLLTQEQAVRMLAQAAKALSTRPQATTPKE